MSYHPRIEASDVASLCTIRTRNSELWFINNQRLEDNILGNLAKCRERYKANVFAAAIQGNHLHDVIMYPESNRADFKRDLNSSIAKGVARYVPSYPGGTLFARRYSAEYIPDKETIEEYFWYTVLQCVKDGLVERISEFPGYNCFSDAVSGAVRHFKQVNWKKYNDRKRWDRKCKITDFIEIYDLKYDRLPGYEHMTQKDYKALMLKKLEERRQKIVAERRAQGLGFMGREKLLAQAPGVKPRHTKTSTETSHRPRVLSVDDKMRAAGNAWYYDFYFKYKAASKAYRAGDVNAKFPPGSYKPPVFTCRVKALPQIQEWLA